MVIAHRANAESRDLRFVVTSGRMPPAEAGSGSKKIRGLSARLKSCPDTITKGEPALRSARTKVLGRDDKRKKRGTLALKASSTTMATEAQIASAATLVSTNPATGEVLGELPCATPEDVRNAVLRAKAAQPRWQATSVADRIAVLRRFQRLLSDRRDSVSQLICREVGKPTAEALATEVLVVLDATEFCIRHAHGFLRVKPLPHGNILMNIKRGKLLREPYGVIGIIAPWNYPFSTPASETLAALVTGNAVVLKPSELTPLIALELERLFRDAGLDPDLFQVMVGEGPTGAALVESPVDKLIFTGSVGTGKAGCGVRRATAAAGRAGAGRQGSDDRAGRRRPRSHDQRRALGRVHERRPDLSVGRALLCASQPVRAVSGDVPQEDRQAARGQWHRLRGRARAR